MALLKEAKEMPHSILTWRSRKKSLLMLTSVLRMETLDKKVLKVKRSLERDSYD